MGERNYVFSPVEQTPTFKKAGEFITDPNIINLLGGVADELDPEGVGGALGRSAGAFNRAKSAQRATNEALRLTPQGQPGPTSVRRNRDGTTTVTSDILPSAQRAPDRDTLNLSRTPSMNMSARQRIIARANQLNIDPVMAMNIVSYDLANTGPLSPDYDPDTALSYYAELRDSLGDDDQALIAYRGEGDPDYVNKVRALTPQSRRAISSVPYTGAPNDVARTLAPYPTQGSREPKEVDRQESTPAVDLRGLTPDDVFTLARIVVDNRGVDAEVAREVGVTTRALSKSKIDAAKSVANSGLSKSDRQTLLDVLSAASTPAEIEAVEVATANAPAPASAGVDRDAVSAELYGSRYYDLDSTQQARVNAELNERLAPTAEVVTTEDGVFVVNKRTNRARQVTIAPPGLGTTEPTTQTVPNTPVPPTAPGTTPPRQITADTTLDDFVSAVSADPRPPAPNEPLRGKPFNEFQARAYGYGSRALQAEVIASELEKDPTNRAEIGKLGPYLTRKLEALGENNVAGYAGGALATTTRLIPDIVASIEAGRVPSPTMLRGLTPVMRDRLTTLSGVGKALGTGALTTVVTNILASTFAEPVAQLFRSNEEQQYEQAKLDFIASLLRRESGAAISIKEYLDYGKRYFPQVNEGEPSIAQKRAARYQVIRLLQIESGRPLLPPIRGLVAPAPPEPTKPTTENVLSKLVGQYRPAQIVEGRLDNIVRQMMDLSDEELRNIVARSGLTEGYYTAIRERLRLLKK